MYGSDWDNIPEPDPWFAMVGMITRQYPGKLEVPMDKIHKTRVLKTVLQGHTVYEAR